VINDEKLGGDPLLTEDITDDALNAMRFLPDVVTSARLDKASQTIRFKEASLTVGMRF
jgi:hypothetical protein